MIINGIELLKAAPIKDMESGKVVAHGMTYGCSEAGYDIRIKQEICFKNDKFQNMQKFYLASAIEEFQMPPNLVGRVCDKSSWARKGLSVFNTVIEPGWKGFLTLELVYHGNTELIIPAGAPIAQILFEEIANPAHYAGRYQNQANQVVGYIKAE
jgi:dCTP deaminase